MLQSDWTIWEIWIKATMKYHLIFGEDTEKLEPVYTHPSGDNVKQFNH